ncbi:DEAD/DEAH box helicase family protein (plasmid) [Paenarthrobacter sp. SD-1]|uniref:DEAD/DEAH box helicase family protein n=1 Tax=Paenarthrobacter ureafaciens TaxID=37931 RepID=A0AAX3EQD2_PAEUR|nr:MULTISPECIES: type ISP restriction/modification enzyme [Paenarthrobacter]MDO5878307.1 DEAD/DEAH box helicase family protein [Paenarthrobacter sp. SD-1]UYW00224.1 DEAD/DEAH box helicase family protein [Paenarthrobacter ureafaciens]
MTAFDDLLDQYRAMSDSERMKGNYFEQIVKQFLINDGVHAPQYKDVWLWEEWPGRDGQPDLGIDLVAGREDGGVTAIQCKFYAEGHKIQKAQIDSFMSNSGKPPYTHRLIVDTTGADWSPNAEAMLEGQYIPAQRIGLADLRNSNIDWSSYRLAEGNKPKLHDKKQLRPHQHDAVKLTIEGFESADRGKLIMACGTGKTFTALKVAEQMAEQQNQLNVLFLVPSLALLSQSLKEWSENATVPLHAYAVCSDIKVGRSSTGELTDIQIHDLQIPATTDGKKLFAEQQKRQLSEGMTVIFSTYQSIDAITEAQEEGLADFDLIICDEAHRTTGVTLQAETKESAFVKIHDNGNVAGAKRLYMTATPRVFNDRIKDAAAEKDAFLVSMDDEDLYGRTFYRIGFGQAVSEGLLTDYKVLVLGVDVKEVADLMTPSVIEASTELNIDDLAKLIGCWNGLAKRRAGSFETDFGIDTAPMQRAVAFNKDIATSKLVAEEFEELVRVHLSDLYNEDTTDDLRVEVKHVDGNDNALVRGERLDWLKAEPVRDYPVCRVLTNARCLTEGVDVPSLDAVMFLNPRNSQVDVIQAVGRVMRSFKNADTGEAKRFGYIILPIAIPEGATPENALRDNDRYRVVWQVLQALRSHDERMDAAINQIDLNDGRPENIIVEKVSLTPRKKAGPGLGTGTGGDSESWHTGDGNDEGQGNSSPGQGVVLPLTFPAEEWKDAVYAKIVRECGNRMYWLDWASDIAEIAGKHILLIRTLLEQATPEKRTAFEGFVEELRNSLNPAIDHEQAIEMLAQHLVTKPVFDAMFKTASFTEKNVVSVAMQKVLDELASEDVFEAERAGLEKFYASVQRRVEDLNSVSAKQSVIIDLYDHFFKKAFPRIAERLGIVFTPIPVVNYILRSANDVLQTTFGKSLSDEGVSVLEPFVGTGTFITQLLRSGLIQPEDLERKYKQEIYANEIVLLSYYIASINIESVYGEVAKDLLGKDDYEPFEGIVLTDTFQLNEHEGAVQSIALPENSARVKRQKDADIRVIVMNPPYSVGQKSGNDNNQNLKYAKLDKAITDTYAKQSDSTLKASLYDSYYRAIRWASDRIKDKGIIAFVSNGGFIDGAAAQGLRRTFISEFSSIFIYNLRGRAIGIKGEARRKEGGNVFADGTKTQVAIAVLVKDNAHLGDARLFYRDIGDYLSREEKIDILNAEISLAGTDWQELVPNHHGDWINVRDDSFTEFQPLGDKETKGRQETPALFKTFSNGLKTNRDSWVYNFSSEVLAANVDGMIAYYNSEVQRWSQHKLATAAKPGTDEHLSFINYDDTKFAWDRINKADLKRERTEAFHPEYIRSALYRPFVKEKVYFDPTQRFNNCTYQLPGMFPGEDYENLAFGGTGIGSTNEFNVLMTNVIPDLELNSKAQWCAFYTYEKNEDDGTMFSFEGEIVGDYIRRENITDEALANYRLAYDDDSITKWDIFFYVYALLHHPSYREAFRADLKKLMPRIPQVQEFHSFATIGKKLSDLHTTYESVAPYPLEEVHGKSEPHDDDSKYDFYAVDGSMSWGARKDKTTIVLNKNVTLRGIPSEALQYQPNGKAALEWVVERYATKQDNKSQVWNDANDHSRSVGDPRYIVDLVKRVTNVSIGTVELVNSLPAYVPLEKQLWTKEDIPALAKSGELP